MTGFWYRWVYGPQAVTYRVWWSLRICSSFSTLYPSWTQSESVMCLMFQTRMLFRLNRVRRAVSTRNWIRTASIVVIIILDITDITSLSSAIYGRLVR